MSVKIHKRLSGPAQPSPAQFSSISDSVFPTLAQSQKGQKTKEVIVYSKVSGILCQSWSENFQALSVPPNRESPLRLSTCAQSPHRQEPPRTLEEAQRLGGGSRPSPRLRSRLRPV